MLYREASKLRRGDTVVVKATGESVRVLLASKIREPETRPLILLAVRIRREGYTVLTHRSVE